MCTNKTLPTQLSYDAINVLFLEAIRKWYRKTHYENIHHATSSWGPIFAPLLKLPHHNYDDGDERNVYIYVCVCYDFLEWL